MSSSCPIRLSSRPNILIFNPTYFAVWAIKEWVSQENTKNSIDKVMRPQSESEYTEDYKGYPESEKTNRCILV